MNEIEKFDKKYFKEEKEILFLASNQEICGGKVGSEKYWTMYLYFIAFFDLDKNELKIGNGRIEWLETDEEREDKKSLSNSLKKGYVIYKMKVRELIDKTVPEGRTPSAYNSFMFVQMLEKNVENKELENVLKEYLKPVIIEDSIFGTLTLNKDYGMFNGKAKWIDEERDITISVDMDNKDSWDNTITEAKNIFINQKERDKKFKDFTAEKLTELSNEWAEDDDDYDGKEITKEDFIKRISLLEFGFDERGNFIAYYDDDDMFFGHVIAIYGNIKEGLKDASIEG